MNDCKHEDKAYANFLLTSHPTQQQWVCKKCGERGTDILGHCAAVSEYEDIIKHFKQEK